MKTIPITSLFVCAMTIAALVLSGSAAHAQSGASIIDYQYDVHCNGNFHQQSNYHYDPAAARKLAKYAAAAYEIKPEESDWVNRQKLQEYLESDYQNILIFNDRSEISLQAFAQDTPTKIFISVKGSVELHDWLQNFDSVKDAFNPVSMPAGNIKVHRGFLNQAKKLDEFASTVKFPDGQTLHEKIINSDKDVFIAGHSLGGAVATLYAAALRENGLPKRRLSVYTFGAPAAGDKKFADRYDVYRDTGVNLFRVRNRDDVVPYVTYIRAEKSDIAACAANHINVPAPLCLAPGAAASVISHKYHQIGFLRVHSPGAWSQGGGRQLNNNSGATLRACGEVDNADYSLSLLGVEMYSSDTHQCLAMVEHSMLDRYLPHVNENHALHLPVDRAPECYRQHSQGREYIPPNKLYGSKFQMDRYATSADYTLATPRIVRAKIQESVLYATLKFEGAVFTATTPGIADSYRNIAPARNLEVRVDAVAPYWMLSGKHRLATLREPGEEFELQIPLTRAHLEYDQTAIPITLKVYTDDLAFTLENKPISASVEIVVNTDGMGLDEGFMWDHNYVPFRIVFDNLAQVNWDRGFPGVYGTARGYFSAGEKFKLCRPPLWFGNTPFSGYVLHVRGEDGEKIILQGGPLDSQSNCTEFTMPDAPDWYHFLQTEARFGEGEDAVHVGLGFHGEMYAVFDKDAPFTPVPTTGGRLNDTGIVWSGHATSGNATTCDPAHPAGQDCHYGRDALAAAGLLQKVGSSALNNGIANGFDYTKISNSGNELPASAALGIGPNDWACTRDNVTGLIWEVKVDNTAHLRHQSHGYTWYNPASPDGNPGVQGNSGTCGNTLGGQLCNTHTYTQAVNAQGLCGHSDWRMPDIVELEGITDKGRVILAIDPQFFPNTPSSLVWSGSPGAHSSDGAWGVVFGNGYANTARRSDYSPVRLVRGGQ